ncbi:hypothetical protein E2C01_061671 [Portunus trituberculatus]|uniref:Uncharacterized protein n=1 Tax=Portunus trituberculatus TaxID=210409 RepID=A0A5B7HFW4_PORTR|nr:hypothetical protein [Portunus trituberculatus]
MVGVERSRCKSSRRFLGPHCIESASFITSSLKPCGLHITLLLGLRLCLLHSRHDGVRTSPHAPPVVHIKSFDTGPSATRVCPCQQQEAGRGSIGQSEGGMAKVGCLYEACFSLPLPPAPSTTAAQGQLGPLTSSLDLATTTAATVPLSSSLSLPPDNECTAILTRLHACLPRYHYTVNSHDTV